MDSKSTINILILVKSHASFVNPRKKFNTHTCDHHMFSSLHLILIVIVNTFILSELVYLILETVLKLQATVLC